MGGGEWEEAGNIVQVHLKEIKVDGSVASF